MNDTTCVFISNWPHDDLCYQCSQPRSAHEEATYVVKVRYQFPAWNEREGIESEPVVASSKLAAIKAARRQLERDGHCGSGCAKGLQWFSARLED